MIKTTKLDFVFEKHKREAFIREELSIEEKKVLEQEFHQYSHVSASACRIVKVRKRGLVLQILPR